MCECKQVGNRGLRFLSAAPLPEGRRGVKRGLRSGTWSSGTPQMSSDVLLKSRFQFEELVARGRDNLPEHLAGNSRQATRCEGRRQNLVIAHEEEIGRCAFRQ